MCCFGMYQDTPGGPALVKKPTGFMTNAKGISTELGVQCEGGHRHIQLLNGRARRAEVYPDELCWKILKGLINQLKLDGRIATGSIGVSGPEEEDHNRELNAIWFPREKVRMMYRESR